MRGSRGREFTDDFYSTTSLPGIGESQSEITLEELGPQTMGSPSTRRFFPLVFVSKRLLAVGSERSANLAAKHVVPVLMPVGIIAPDREVCVGNGSKERLNHLGEVVSAFVIVESKADFGAGGKFLAGSLKESFLVGRKHAGC